MKEIYCRRQAARLSAQLNKLNHTLSEIMGEELKCR
jgi:hypothetical protein